MGWGHCIGGRFCFEGWFCTLMAWRGDFAHLTAVLSTQLVNAAFAAAEAIVVRLSSAVSAAALPGQVWQPVFIV
jgi:hypothetical protein